MARATRSKPAPRAARPSPKALSPLLDAWLSKRYAYAHILAPAYKRAKPFPHIVLRSIFRPQKAEALRKALVAIARKDGFQRKESDLFSLSQSPDLHSVPGKEFAELVALFESTEWRDYISTLTGVRLASTSRAALGKKGESSKNQLLDIGASLYLDGDYLLCHDDRVTGRKVAFIYYLGPDFKAADGGALALLANNGKKPGDVVVRHLPAFNTLAMFTVSEKSWHAVEEVLRDKPRLSINGWFH